MILTCWEKTLHIMNVKNLTEIVCVHAQLYTTLQIKGQFESVINVWFGFLHSQK
jgi:hypothetical protein